MHYYVHYYFEYNRYRYQLNALISIMYQKNYEKKSLKNLSLGFGLCAFTGAAANASIVSVSFPGGLSSFTPGDTTVNWDVDSDGNDDLRFVAVSSRVYTSSSSIVYKTNKFVQIQALGDARLFRLDANNLKAFDEGDPITGQVADNTAFQQGKIYSASGTGFSTSNPDALSAFNATPKIVAFQTTVGDKGWFQMSSGTIVSPSISLSNFNGVGGAYEDAGGSILAGQAPVPEPESVAMTLGGLAMGAAFVLKMRRKNQRRKERLFLDSE